MTLDAQERGVFSLDITATDQALSSNERKSSTVRVRVRFCFNVGSFVCLSVCLFGWLFVCLELCSQTLYFVFSLSRWQAKVFTAAGDLRKPTRNGGGLGKRQKQSFKIVLRPLRNRSRAPHSLARHTRSRPLTFLALSKKNIS